MPRLCRSATLRGAVITLLVFAACYGQVDVIYTGRTLGYLRFPERQQPNQNKCDPDPKNMKGPAKEFYDALQAQRTPASPLTVGMEDNFGPELDARTFDGFPASTPKEQQIPHPGKDLFVWDFLAEKPAWVADSAVSSALLTQLEHHSGIIPTDNVGCFLRVAGYHAVAVGKHDFEAGPEHLIMMAKFLMSDVPGITKTAMLGANLAISTAMPDAKPRVPLYQIEHTFEALEAQRKTHTPPFPSYSVMFPPQRDVPTPTPKIPSVVFPWMKEVEIENAFFLCDAKTKPTCSEVFAGDLQGKRHLVSDPNNANSPIDSLLDAVKASTLVHLVPPDAPKTPGGTSVTLGSRIGEVQLCRNPTREPYGFLNALEPDCTPLKEKHGADFNAHLSGKITFEIGEELRPDHNYAICVEIPDGGCQRRFSCQPFYVATPFFSSSTGAQNQFGDYDADPFTVREIQGQKIAVFGVLDPDLQNQIGRLNYGWWNHNTAYETTVQVADPATSLKQTMMRCEKRPDCKQARKVLLAQMPAFKVAPLLASIDKTVFDLVVAQTDSANKTGAAILIRTGIGPNSGGNYVVTPDDLYSPGKISYKFQRAIVTRTPADPGQKLWNWQLTNALPADEVSIAVSRPEEGQPSLRQVAEQALTEMKVNAKVNAQFAKWSYAEVLQRLALLAMQQEEPADLSMMQSRDFFEPQTFGRARATKDNLQALLDQVFWKNDFAVRVPVTGATLTAVLSASADFETLDKNPLNTDPEKGRSLVTLGVFKEAAETNLAVNGGIVDPAKLYSVTLTDFLAVGDTGYPQLKSPAVPLPYRMKDFPQLRSISGMVCQAIQKHVPEMHDAACLGVALDAKTYLDTSSQLPPDTGPGFTAKQQTRAYLDYPLREDRFKRFYDGQNAAERVSAQKPFWSISMEKGDFGLNFNLHKKFAGSQVQTKGLTNEFSGVQIAAVTAPNSYTVTFDDRTRLKRSSQSIDFYALDDVSLSYARTQDAADNNFTRNLSINSLSFESGFLRHMKPHLRGPRQLDLLVAARVDSNVLSPREDIAIAAQTCLGQSNCPTPCPPGTTTTATGPCTAMNPAGTLRGTIRRSADLYGKFGLRVSDTRSWFEVGLLDGWSLQVPYSLQLLNGQAYPNNVLYLEPGSSGNGNCTATSTTNPCAAPTNQKSQDWLAYLSYYGFLTPNTKFRGVYQTHPLDGVFLNFSFNVPLPFGNRFADWAGGKGIAFLAENNGRFLFNRAQDLPAQTSYYDKLSLSFVIPVVGNFSLKPETDFVYYRDKVAGLPFHSIDYLMTFSYTFDWRQGQPWGRALRFASPPPTVTVPTSGR